MSVAILGPDGEGKSSLSVALCQALKDGERRRVRRVKISVHSARMARGPMPMPWIIRTLRVARILVLARLAARRGELLIWDRHPMEDRSLATEGRSVTGRGRRWLALLAGTPDVLLVLDAPAEVLAERDARHDVATLERLRHRYLELADLHSVAVLDAERPPAVLRNGALGIVRGFERRHGGSSV
jgi:thymidylate kinase